MFLAEISYLDNVSSYFDQPVDLRMLCSLRTRHARRPRSACAPGPKQLANRAVSCAKPVDV